MLDGEGKVGKARRATGIQIVRRAECRPILRGAHAHAPTLTRGRGADESLRKRGEARPRYWLCQRWSTFILGSSPWKPATLDRLRSAR